MLDDVALVVQNSASANGGMYAQSALRTRAEDQQAYFLTKGLLAVHLSLTVGWMHCLAHPPSVRYDQTWGIDL